MNSQFECIEERINMLEKLVLGDGNNEHQTEQLVNSVLSIANKLDSLTTKHEAVKTTFERVGDILKYSDPLCISESEALIPNTVKYQLVLSEEENLKGALDQLNNLEILKNVLDSQPIKNLPQIEPKLNQLSSQQIAQENQLLKLTTETYTLLQNYTNLVNHLSQKLEDVEKLVNTMDNK